MRKICLIDNHIKDPLKRPQNSRSVFTKANHNLETDLRQKHNPLNTPLTRIVMRSALTNKSSRSCLSTVIPGTSLDEGLQRWVQGFEVKVDTCNNGATFPIMSCLHPRISERLACASHGYPSIVWMEPRLLWANIFAIPQGRFDFSHNMPHVMQDRLTWLWKMLRRWENFKQKRITRLYLVDAKVVVGFPVVIRPPCPDNALRFPTAPECWYFWSIAMGLVSDLGVPTSA